MEGGVDEIFLRPATDDLRRPDGPGELFLAAYSRHSNDAERTTGLEYLAKSKDRSQALEDILWTILNSKEFLFQH